MQLYDIVFIKGNPNSGSFSQHENINNTIVKLFSNFSYKTIESEENNNKNTKKIPEAKVYVGFSRGSRYLKKLSKDTLKISIGGISGSSINVFTNKRDCILKGDISSSSLDAHFIIEEEHKILIKKLISNFIDN